MKTLDRIIFIVIAVALCVLAVRSLQVTQVEAAREEIIKIDISRIGGSPYPVVDLMQLLRDRK